MDAIPVFLVYSREDCRRHMDAMFARCVMMRKNAKRAPEHALCRQDHAQKCARRVSIVVEDRFDFAVDLFQQGQSFGQVIDFLVGNKAIL